MTCVIEESKWEIFYNASKKMSSLNINVIIFSTTVGEVSTSDGEIKVSVATEPKTAEDQETGEIT